MLGNRVVRALAVCLLSASTAAAQSYFYGPTQQSSGGGGGSSFISSLGAVGSSPNDNACSVDGSGVFQMQPASSTKPGVLTTGTQTIAGAKIWSGAAVFQSTLAATGAVTGSNLSGTNTGDAPVRAAPQVVGMVTHAAAGGSTVTVNGHSYQVTSAAVNVDNTTLDINLGHTMATTDYPVIATSHSASNGGFMWYLLSSTSTQIKLRATSRSSGSDVNISSTDWGVSFVVWGD